MPRIVFLAFVLGLFSAPLAVRAETPVPPIDYHLRVLPNGLKVYSVLDRSAPDVTVQVWYGVGAKNDPPGRSGFAHLFEHLMFKGSRDMPPEYLDRLTEDVGGENNASTDSDYTEYHETIPPNHLEQLLWAEAERMGALVVDQANFTSERQVVEEELRMRVLADPYGRLFELDLPEASFSVHPYHRPPIGSIADLDASDLAEVRAFHAVYYRPDNANLIVVGNFDPAALDAWVDKYFGPIRRPATAIPVVTAREPARTQPSVITAYGPNVPLPAVVFSYPAPPASSADAATLQVLDAILSTGKSSRLYQSLVYDKQLAQTIFSEADLRQQAGLFAIGAIAAGGKTLAQNEAALDAEIARLKTAPVSAAELAAAKNQLLAQALNQRETVEGRGMEIGQAILVEGDAARVNTDDAALQAVTAAQVQDAARRILDAGRRVTIHYLPESERPAGQPDVLVQDEPQIAAVPLPPVNAPVVEMAAEGARQPPPPVGPPFEPTLPQAAERTLPNGLRVIVAKTGDIPIATAMLTLRAGAASDPAALPGLADMTVDLAAQGAGGLSASALAAQVEALGGTLETNAGYDDAAISLRGLATSLPQTLPLLADVALKPAFAQDELERLRAQKIDALTVSLQDPGAAAQFALPRVVFGPYGPYGHPASGAPSALKAMRREDVAGDYARLFRPDQAILVLTGDIDPEAGFALAEKNFGGWTNPSGPPALSATAPAVRGGQVVVVDVPGAGQAAVAVAGPSIRRLDPDFDATEVENAVLGGGYSARLNEEVRVKRGLSYGASSSLDARRDGGLFEAFAQTRNDAAAQVAGLVMGEISGLKTHPADLGELAARKASLTGEFERTAATSGGMAALLAGRAAYDVPLAELGRHVRDLEAVTPAQAQAAADRLVDPAGVDILVAGDAKLFLSDLKKAYPALRVIELDALDPSAGVSVPGTPPARP